MIDIPSGYTIDGKTWRNLWEEVKWLHANFEEMIASGAALPAATAADAGRTVQVDSEGKWNKGININTISDTVDGLVTDVETVNLRINQINNTLGQISITLAQIVSGDIGEE